MLFTKNKTLIISQVNTSKLMQNQYKDKNENENKIHTE